MVGYLVHFVQAEEHDKQVESYLLAYVPSGQFKDAPETHELFIAI
jgi:hypothetical protein